VFLVGYIYGSLRSVQDGNKSLGIRIAEFAISILLLLLFHLLITNIIYYAYLVVATGFSAQEIWSDFQPYILASVLSRALDLFIILILIKLLEGYWTFQKQKLQVVSLENQLHLSQLDALRVQLNPHFLFNTLHTLHSLIGYDDEKARSMLIKVTSLMRKTLDQRGKHLISLGEELEYTQNYLDIEQERFHDRLKVVLDIAEEAKSIQIPALILQPLVENAFKHGISLIESNGEIHLSAKLKNEQLILELRNTVAKETKLSKIPSSRLGLNNVKNRLDQVYGDQYEFSKRRVEDQFIIRITLQNQKES
jgi:LytS/YehU family sensor histidine kinase